MWHVPHLKYFPQNKIFADLKKTEKFINKNDSNVAGGPHNFAHNFERDRIVFQLIKL